MTPSRADQSARLLDDILEDLARLAQDRDPGRDLAQRLLGAGPAGEGVA